MILSAPAMPACWRSTVGTVVAKPSTLAWASKSMVGTSSARGLAVSKFGMSVFVDWSGVMNPPRLPIRYPSNTGAPLRRRVMSLNALAKVAVSTPLCE